MNLILIDLYNCIYFKDDYKSLHDNQIIKHVEWNFLLYSEKSVEFYKKRDFIK